MPIITYVDKETSVYIHNRILFCLKEQNYDIFRKMVGTGNLYVKQIKSDQEKNSEITFKFVRVLFSRS